MLSSEPKRDRGLALLPVAALAAFAIMVGLGVWQLQRLAWKQHLIEQIGQRVHAPPVPVERLLTNADDAEYTHVSVTGRLHHEWERYLYATGEGDWGWDVFTPLELADSRLLLVNRGYVPRQRLDRVSRAEGLTPGEVTITGLLRKAPAARPWWTPAGDATKGLWYWPEIAAMAASVPAGSNAIANIYIDSDLIAAPAPPMGGTTNLTLANRHLEYALTWFALAATFAVIYAVFVAHRLRAARG